MVGARRSCLPRPGETADPSRRFSTFAQRVRRSPARGRRTEGGSRRRERCSSTSTSTPASQGSRPPSSRAWPGRGVQKLCRCPGVQSAITSAHR